MESFGEIVGRNVKRLRRGRNWTQLRLAEDSGLSLRGVQDIESGKGSPKQDSIDAIAGALGVATIELMVPFESQTRNSSPREELLRLLNQLDEPSVAVILGAVKALIDDRKSTASNE